MWSLLILPNYRFIKVWYWLHTKQDEIQFKPKLNWDGVSFTTSDGNPKIGYIECRLPITENTYLEWKMTEQGELVTRLADTGRPKWWRERLCYFVPRDEKEGLYRYLKHKPAWTVSKRFLYGKLLRKYASEPFIMAKMKGFTFDNDEFM